MSNPLWDVESYLSADENLIREFDYAINRITSTNDYKYGNSKTAKAVREIVDYAKKCRDHNNKPRLIELIKWNLGFLHSVVAHLDKSLSKGLP